MNGNVAKRSTDICIYNIVCTRARFCVWCGLYSARKNKCGGTPKSMQKSGLEGKAEIVLPELFVNINDVVLQYTK